jgi:N-acyl-D-amino-acid deacylase
VKPQLKSLLLVLTGITLLLSALNKDSGVTSAFVQGRQPITGRSVPELVSFDRIIPALMRKWAIPGGAVGVVKDGRLVLAHGYGWADTERRQPVEPDSLFRIASLSKALTAAAVLKLVETGKLKLDYSAFRLLDHIKPPRGAQVDKRIYDITVRQLLQHSGGWDRERSFDPMFRSREMARSLGAPAPASTETVIRYMMGKPLQFEPGARYAYSNFGYCVLGRVIEKVSGQNYEAYVKNSVLLPAGVTSTRLGRTLPRARATKEVSYYGFNGQGLAQSVFSADRELVPWHYGGWYIEAMDAHGGWISSTVDLLRFITAVDGYGTRPDVLRPSTLKVMIYRPLPFWKGSDYWYGMGWLIRPSGGDANWWHMGSLDGTSTIMVRAHNGLAWVALFNSRPKDFGAFGNELDNALWQAVTEVSRWPAHDLF